MKNLHNHDEIFIEILCRKREIKHLMKIQGEPVLIL